MATRFMTFVDGSNLFGTMKHLNVRVDHYDRLYRHIFELAVKQWQSTFSTTGAMAQHVRTYWYVVGSMDDWRLEDLKAQIHLRERFDQDEETRKWWLREAGTALNAARKPTDQKAVASEAWTMCFADFRAWYEKKRRTLDGMDRFHYAVEASTDFIEICRVGRWKVNFLNKSLDEKGLDTSFAVDMVGLASAYDVALLITGDADGIPSVSHVKQLGKHVGVVEFLKGYPPEKRGKNSASQLKVAADFVVQVYEMELVKSGIATSGEPTMDTPGDGKAIGTD